MIRATLAAAVLGASGVAHAGPHVDPEGGPDARAHVRLDTAATWGIGGQMFLGGQLHATTYVPVWRTGRATGSLDVGVLGAYGNEAAFLAPWIDRETTTGAGHRVQLLASVGHTFHLGRQRRVALGVHALAGWNRWMSSYAVTIPEAGIDERATVARDLFVGAAQVELAVRLTEVVGVNLSLLAPFPTASSYAITYGSIGIGPTFYLR